MDDPFDLQRFVDAQRTVMDVVRSELLAGRKSSHFMWFVFPQLAGLGSSPMARRYAISGQAEAAAYLAHPELGLRLREYTALVNAVSQRSVTAIFGEIDALKLRSCMTLFACVATDNAIFLATIEKYYDGQFDPLTLRALGVAEPKRG